MFIAACLSKDPSPVRAAFVETFLQNTVKTPKLTPMVLFSTAPGVVRKLRVPSTAGEVCNLANV